MAYNSMKRKYSNDDVEMDLDSIPQANGATNGVENGHHTPEPHRATPSFLHVDPRPDDVAHAGMRRSIALALDHVGFDSADTAAVESFALATEECKASRVDAVLATHALSDLLTR